MRVSVGIPRRIPGIIQEEFLGQLQWDFFAENTVRIFFKNPGRVTIGISGRIIEIVTEGISGNLLAEFYENSKSNSLKLCLE